ncbi:hypothetical protein V8C42DRAFT_331384 [Trichoderma barbatum]
MSETASLALYIHAHFSSSSPQFCSENFPSNIHLTKPFTSIIRMKTLILLSAALFQVRAAEVYGDLNGNLTVVFFPDSQGDSCKANDISKAITLTTNTRPEAYTCFNMSDIFSQKSSTGFQMTTDQRYINQTNGLNGVAWSLHNQNLYDANATYSHTWLRMANISGGQEGKESEWNFYQYTLPDCQDVRIGVEESDDVPFSWTNCQTSEDGLCRATGGYPIGSFAIFCPRRQSGDKVACDKWVQYGVAATAKTDVGRLVMAVVVATLAVL